MTPIRISKVIIFAVLLVALLNLSGATTTVSLTGGCTHNLVNGNNSYITFNLANTGNGTATNLLVVPQLSGAYTYNSIENLSLIGPGRNASFNFYLYNLSLPGSYAEGFIVQYVQTGVTGFAAFPCLLNIGQQTLNQASITGTKFVNGKLTVTVFDLSQAPLSINLSILAPPTFNITPKVRTINVQPGSFANATFNVSILQNTQFVNASYAVAAMLSYATSGVHYASFSTTLINQSTSNNQGFQLGSLMYILLIAVIIVIIILIIASLLVKRHKPHEAT